MKIPIDQKYQFKVLLRIFEKMFKEEMTSERIDSIISTLDDEMRMSDGQ